MQCFEFVDNKCLVLKKYLQYETCLFDHFYMQVRCILHEFYQDLQCLFNYNSMR